MSGNKFKTVYKLNLAIFSNHKTSIISETKKDNARELIAMLLERNPTIDTAEDRVLSAKEYDEVVSGLR